MRNNRENRLFVRYVQTFISVACVIMVSFTASCSNNDNKDITACAHAFAQNYFNLRYSQAASLCTQRSAKWIKLKASNIHQADLDVLNNQTDTATCSVDDIIIVNNDTAVATVTANNFIDCSDIGKSGHMCSKAVFEITIVRDKDQWTVDMSEPLKERRDDNKK